MDRLLSSMCAAAQAYYSRRLLRCRLAGQGWTEAGAGQSVAQLTAEDAQPLSDSGTRVQCKLQGTSGRVFTFTFFFLFALFASSSFKS